MSTEVLVPEQPGVLATQPEPTSMLQAVMQAVRDPNLDVDKLERLLAIGKDLEAEQAKKTFTSAMARLKPRLPIITKRGSIWLNANTSISYAKYEDIHEAVTPLLTEEGFVVSYTSELIPGASNILKVTANVKHVGGHSESGSVFLPLTDSSGAKNSVQGSGSILSYGKRYALCQYLDIVSEDQDDDGNGGGVEPISQEQVDTLSQWLDTVKANRPVFLDYMGVSRLEDIKVRDHAKAVAALKKKEKRG